MAVSHEVSPSSVVNRQLQQAALHPELIRSVNPTTIDCEAARIFEQFQSGVKKLEHLKLSELEAKEGLQILLDQARYSVFRIDQREIKNFDQVQEFRAKEQAAFRSTNSTCNTPARQEIDSRRDEYAELCKSPLVSLLMGLERQAFGLSRKAQAVVELRSDEPTFATVLKQHSSLIIGIPEIEQHTFYISIRGNSEFQPFVKRVVALPIFICSHGVEQSPLRYEFDRQVGNLFREDFKISQENPAKLFRDLLKRWVVEGDDHLWQNPRRIFEIPSLIDRLQGTFCRALPSSAAEVDLHSMTYGVGGSGYQIGVSPSLQRRVDAVLRGVEREKSSAIELFKGSPAEDTESAKKRCEVIKMMRDIEFGFRREVAGVLKHVREGVELATRLSNSLRCPEGFSQALALFYVVSPSEYYMIPTLVQKVFDNYSDTIRQ